MPIPTTTDEILEQLHSILLDKKLLKEKEKEIFYYDTSYISNLDNLIVHFLCKSAETYYCIISNYSGYKLWKILSSLMQNIKLKILYKKSKYLINEQLMFFIYNMQVYKFEGMDEKILDRFNEIYDWMQKRNVQFVKVKNLRIPIYKDQLTDKEIDKEKIISNIIF